MAALFNGSINNQDNIINYISECKTMGIRVLPPDVNHSTKHFTVTAAEFRITEITIAHFERDFTGKVSFLEKIPSECLEPIRVSMKRLKNRDFKQEADF